MAGEIFGEKMKYISPIYASWFQSSPEPSLTPILINGKPSLSTRNAHH
jgi:hypothetical protein